MMRRFMGGALVALLATATGVSAVPRAGRVQGRVEYRAPRASAWTAVTEGTEIPEGTRIQTSLGSRLEIALDDGSKTTLRENSIFEVLRASDNRYEFRLWIGGLRNVVRPMEPGGTYQVRTPIATAGVRGTDFDIGVSDDNTTNLRVFDGTVWLRSDLSDQEVVIPAGSGSTASADGSVTAPSAHGAAAPDDDVRSGAASASSGATTQAVEIRIESPSEGAVVGAGTIAVVGTGAPGVRLRIAGQDATCDVAGRFAATVTLLEGPNVIAVESENGLSRTQVTVMVDATIPSLQASVLSGYVTNQPALPLSITTLPGATVTAGGQTAVASGGQAQFTLTLVEGQNLIPVEVVGANGKKATSTILVYLDTLPPQLTIISISNVTGGVRVSGLTEALASVTANGYPVDVRSDGSFDGVLSGLVSPVTLEARDQAGNLSQNLRNVEGAVDVSAPTLVSLTFSPSTAEAGASVTASLSVSDASAVQPTVTLTLSGPGGSTLSGTLAAAGTTYQGTILVPASATAGTYTADAVQVADNIGNAATLTPAASLVVVNNAPTATVTASDAGSGGNVTVTWSSDDPDVASYTVVESPGGAVVYSGSAAGSVTLTGRNNASYTYSATATDLAGNVSLAATAGVTITDGQVPGAPGMPTSSPSGNGGGSGLYMISWAPATDGSTAPGATVLRYGLDMSVGGGSFTLVSEADGMLSLPVTLGGGATYSFRAKARDSAGNWGGPSGTLNVTP